MARPASDLTSSMLRFSGFSKSIVASEPMVPPSSGAGTAAPVQAVELAWGREAAADCAATHGPFDIIICCDCVYEPLYGRSWVALAETLAQLLSRRGDGQALTEPCAHPPRAFVSVERRDQDGIPSFLDYLHTLGMRTTVVQCEGRGAAAVSCVNSELGGEVGDLIVYEVNF